MHKKQYPEWNDYSLVGMESKPKPPCSINSQDGVTEQRNPQ